MVRFGSALVKFRSVRFGFDRISFGSVRFRFHENKSVRFGSVLVEFSFGSVRFRFLRIKSVRFGSVKLIDLFGSVRFRFSNFGFGSVEGQFLEPTHTSTWELTTTTEGICHPRSQRQSVSLNVKVVYDLGISGCALPG